MAPSIIQIVMALLPHAIFFSRQVKYFKPCMDHDYGTMEPVIVPSYIPRLASTSWGAMDGEGGIVAETGTVRESIPVPGTSGARLNYFSTGSGAPSTLDIKLTPEKVPSTLVAVHLKVRIKNLQEVF